MSAIRRARRINDAERKSKPDAKQRCVYHIKIDELARRPVYSIDRPKNVLEHFWSDSLAAVLACGKWHRHSTSQLMSIQ
jgi:hypothetical protein